MDLFAFTADHPLLAALFLPAALPLLGVVFAPFRERVPVLARLSSTYATIFAALWIFLVDAICTTAIVRGIVHRTFEVTELGLVRASAVDVAAVSQSIELLVGVQSLAAFALLHLVPVAIVAAWLRAPTSSVLARATPAVVTFAIGIPVAVGAVCTLAVIERFAPGFRHTISAWEVANLVEVGRWAIVGLAAITLTAATPIVVEAASRGIAISSRGYLGAQLLFVIGLGAWVLTRFCAEDVARGPVAELETHANVDEEALYFGTSHEGIELPRGAWCSVDGLDLRREIGIPLVLTHSLEGRFDSSRFLGVRSWLDHAERSLARPSGRRPVLLAAIDVHVTAEAFAPYLRAAEELGIHDLAIVTFTDDRVRSLTFGDVYTRRPCVLVRTDFAHAREYTLPGVWWGSLSHRLTEESIRRSVPP